MAKYLVTGGCGFIGAHLVELLTLLGHDVRVLDDLSNGTKKYLPKGVDFILGSIADETILRLALNGVEGVFHLAAMVSVPESITHWHKNHLVNCGGSVRLFELATGIPIIFASSAAIYGDAPSLPHKEETPPRPLSPYAVDKLACEMHAPLAWHLHRTPSISFRFFNVYGPRQDPRSSYSGVISKFVDQITQHLPITLFGDGNQLRDFVYVKDVVRILVKAMETPFEGAHVYNLCSGIGTSINALAEMMGTLTGLNITKKYLPPRPGEISLSYGDPSKTYQQLGLKTETSLEQGLTELLLEHHEIKTRTG